MSRQVSRLQGCLAIVSILIASTPFWGCSFFHRYTELIIQDPEAAVWMNLNNTFTLAPNTYFSNESKQLWQGILIQIGKATTPMGPLQQGVQVRIKPKGEEARTYDLGELRWINVQANDPDRDPPMKPEHAGLLWPDPNTPTQCADLEACADKNCLCSAQPCNKEEHLGLIPKRCLRNRSLHAYLEPLAIITYWTGPNGYDLQLRMQGEHNHQHPPQVFRLKDPVDVQLTASTGSVIRFPDVEKIEILLSGKPDHHKVKDPPGNG